MSEYTFRPDILKHPNIPKPLHGLNPRTLMGTAWWDEQRQKAYAEKNYHCWACGDHKSAALFKHWLEAHEMYEYDYKAKTANMTEIVALCHACHNFIHSGFLLRRLELGQASMYFVKQVLIHGMNVLRHCQVPEMFDGTAQLVDALGLNRSGINIMKPAKIHEFHGWKLIIDGKEFDAKFQSIVEWANHYNV